MSQTFNLKLATDSLRSDAEKIGMSIEQLLQIEIKVTAHISWQADSDGLEDNATEASLHLNYKIKLPTQALAEQLHWPIWHKEHVGFSDYLWRQTCLECFISSKQQSYLEINVSPNGQYAVYHFTGYRTPDTMPPAALLTSNNKHRASIEWKDSILNSNKSTDGRTFQRYFSIPLNELPCDLLDASSTVLIHPCVILYFAATPLYFATAHASPADFHQKQYWSKFQLNK